MSSQNESPKEKSGIILVPMNPIHYIAIKDEIDKIDKFSPQINVEAQPGKDFNLSQSD